MEKARAIEKPKLFCTSCDCEICICNSCKEHFDSGNDVYCYDDEHYCESCMDNAIKAKSTQS